MRSSLTMLFYLSLFKFFFFFGDTFSDASYESKTLQTLQLELRVDEILAMFVVLVRVSQKAQYRDETGVKITQMKLDMISLKTANTI